MKEPRVGKTELIKAFYLAHPELTIRQVAQRMSTTPRVVAGALDELEAEGRITRRTSRNGRQGGLLLVDPEVVEQIVPEDEKPLTPDELKRKFAVAIRKSKSSRELTQMLLDYAKLVTTLGDRADFNTYTPMSREDAEDRVDLLRRAVADIYGEEADVPVRLDP